MPAKPLKSLRVALALGAMLAHAACKPEASARPDQSASAAPSASASAGINESPLSTAKRLAMAKPGGVTPVDREIEKLQKALEQKATVSDAWVLLGRSWVRKARDSSDPGFYLNAKACADVALEVMPDNRAATNLVGLVLLNEHKFDDARDLAEQVLAKSPDDLLARGTLSDAFLEVGRYDDAAKAAQRMMDTKPNLPSYSRISYLAWLRGDMKVALDNIKLAADAGRDPKDLEPRCWVLTQAALLFWHQGDYPGADAGFQLALKECADYPPAQVGRGRVAMARREFPRAADLFQASYKQSPLVETAWLLGDARSAAGDAKGADEAYALVIKNGRVIDLRTLALFYATKDREHDEAIKVAETEKKVRDDVYTEDALAWALYRAGKIAEAKVAIDKATALGTKDARLLYHAGAIRIAAGDKAAGEKLVREAVELNPAFDWTSGLEAAKVLAK